MSILLIGLIQFVMIGFILLGGLVYAIDLVCQWLQKHSSDKNSKPK